MTTRHYREATARRGAAVALLAGALAGCGSTTHPRLRPATHGVATVREQSVTVGAGGAATIAASCPQACAGTLTVQMQSPLRAPPVRVVTIAGPEPFKLQRAGSVGVRVVLDAAGRSAVKAAGRGGLQVVAVMRYAPRGALKGQTVESAIVLRAVQS